LIQRSYQGKDKDEYQMEAFQRDEQEGDNLEHEKDAKSAKTLQQDSLQQKRITKPDTTIPVFKTADGRKVLGGGGITPDYVVKSERVTGLVLTIYRNNLFYDFTKNYLEGAGLPLRAKYSKNFEDYKTKYNISDEMMIDFRKFVETKKINIDDKEYTKELESLKARIKAEIARMIFGTEAWISLMIEIDNQIQKALTLFPEAEKVAKLE
jgi:carboxyl-terminal processing protease